MHRAKQILVCCLQIVQNLEHRKPNNPIRNYTNILQKKYHYCKPVVQMIYCSLKLFQFQLRSRSFLLMYLNNVKQLRCVVCFVFLDFQSNSLKYDFIFFGGGRGQPLHAHPVMGSCCVQTGYPVGCLCFSTSPNPPADKADI